MTDITIPPEAIEAAAKAIGEETYVGNKQTLIDAARAACLAMLKAWPGMAWRYRASVSLEPQEIILPLPQEASDEQKKMTGYMG